MTTTHDIDPTDVAERFYRAIGAAWNAGDGAAYGAPFAQDSEFVDVRGVKHHGGPEVIGSSHQGIFDTIYKGSSIVYELIRARLVGDGVVVANGRATLDAPAGPLAGRHHAISTVVLVRDAAASAGWSAVAFHNTLVTAEG